MVPYSHVADTDSSPPSRHMIGAVAAVEACTSGRFEFSILKVVSVGLSRPHVFSQSRYVRLGRAPAHAPAVCGLLVVFRKHCEQRTQMTGKRKGSA